MPCKCGSNLHTFSKPQATGRFGDDAALDEWADQLVAVTTEQGFPLWRAFGTIYRGWIKAKNRDVAEGITLLRNGSAAYRATEAELWMPHFVALLAWACEIARQIEEALSTKARAPPSSTTAPVRNHLDEVERIGNTAERSIRADDQSLCSVRDEIHRDSVDAATEMGRLVGELLRVPGGSRLLIDAEVPYDALALAAFLGFAPGRACSSYTAIATAQSVRARAARLMPAGTDLVASLTSPPKTVRKIPELSRRTSAQCSRGYPHFPCDIR